MMVRYSKMIAIKRMTVVYMLLASLGCSNNPAEISNSKESPVASDGSSCESLEGKYSYHGRLIDGHSGLKKPPVLTNIIFGKPPSLVLPKAVSISHDTIRGTLSARLLGEGIESELFSSMSAQITCNNGRTVIVRSLAGSSDGIRVDGRMRVYVTKDQNGNLIAQRNYRVSSYSFFVIERKRTGEDAYIFNRMVEYDVKGVRAD